MDRRISQLAVQATDRLSSLPDEILRQILIAADLKLKASAQTSILSRRWLSVWKSSLRKLDFHIPSPASDEWNSFVPFVENVMAFHNREYADDLEVLFVSTDHKFLAGMFNLLGRIFAHGLANRVRTLRLAVGRDRLIDTATPGLTDLFDSVENLELSCRGDFYKPWQTNFSALKTLRLYRCVMIPVLVNDPGRCDPFRWIPNLTSLELIECKFRSIHPVKISGDKLVHLTLVDFKVGIFEVFAPQLESFTFKAKIEGVLAHPLKILALDVPASLKCLDVDIYIKRGIPPWEKEEDVCMKMFRFLELFHLVKHVKLRPGTIKVLTMIPGPRDHLPFENIQCVEFHDSDSPISNPRVFNNLVSYFFDDRIRGTALFERVIARLGTRVDENRSKPKIVYKSDLA